MNFVHTQRLHEKLWMLSKLSSCLMLLLLRLYFYLLFTFYLSFHFYFFLPFSSFPSQSLLLPAARTHAPPPIFACLLLSSLSPSLYSSSLLKSASPQLLPLSVSLSHRTALFAPSVSSCLLPCALRSAGGRKCARLAAGSTARQLQQGCCASSSPVRGSLQQQQQQGV